MKSIRITAAVVATLLLSACSSSEGPEQEEETNDIEITQANLSSWTNYMRQVSNLLTTDADNLLKAWTESYNGGAPFATQFKTHSSSEYPSATSAIEEIVDKCAEIANEVGQAKIGTHMLSMQPVVPKKPFMPLNHGTAGTHATTIPTTSAPYVTPISEATT